MARVYVLIASCLPFLACCFPLKYFNIDLDLPPRQRWKEIGRVYREYLVAWAHEMSEYAAANFEPGFLETFVANGNWQHFPDQVEELEGIVEEVNHPDVTLQFLKSLNMVYEMQYNPMCSAVLLAKPDGTVLHGRNMDYSAPILVGNQSKNLEDMTMQITAFKEGKPLFKMTAWPGMNGMHTGMRLNDGYAIDQQTRLGFYDPQMSLAKGKKGGVPFMPMIRKIVETIPDFQTAKDKLYGISFMAPQYIVMSGPKPYEGCVMTLDTLGEHAQDSPPIECVSEKQWYLVQTNFDLNKVSALKGVYDPRRAYTNWALSKYQPTPDIENPEWLAKFMHTMLLFDGMNRFSTVMIPSTNYYNTTLPNAYPVGSPYAWPCVVVIMIMLYCVLPLIMICFVARKIFRCMCRKSDARVVAQLYRDADAYKRLNDEEA